MKEDGAEEDKFVCSGGRAVPFSGQVQLVTFGTFCSTPVSSSINSKKSL